MNILLTGGSGFLGKHLAASLLREGYNITAIGRNEVRDAGIRWIKHDLLHEPSEEIKKKMQNIDVVIHLAALMPSKSVMGDDIVVQNKVMTKNVLSLVDSPKAFILASSVDVYPYSDLASDENTPLDPVSDYGRSKKESEDECLRWSQRNDQIPLTILRFSHLYGPADTNAKMIDTLVRNVLLGKKSQIYGEGADKRTYLYVDDAVRAIQSALKAAKAAGSQIFNVSGEKAYSLKEVISTIEKKIAVKVPLENISTEKKAGNSILSSEKFMKQFGFIPEVALQEGLSRLFPKNIFFDLDGPILDVKDRYYSVYQRFVIANGGNPLSLDDYWQLKRMNTPLGNLLEASKCPGLVVEHKKFLYEHREEYLPLKLDKLQPGTKEVLTHLSNRYNLYLITLRRNTENLLKQLEELGILRYFKEVFTMAPTTEDKWSHKVELLNKPHLRNKAGIIIGDTTTEIIAGKKTGMATIAVSNGIRTREILSQAEPHLIVDSIEELQSLPFFKMVKNS